MKIEEMFHTAAMPAEIIVTPNAATIIERSVKDGLKYSYEKFNWDKSEVIHSPVEMMSPVWLEWNAWDVGDKVGCVCPAAIEGARRVKENNPRVSLLGLDFDSPNAPKLEDLKEALKDFDGFWYTTKSHGKDKKGVVCDRYRVFLAYSRPVSHTENQRIHNLLSVTIGHDSACGDGTRVFMPSVVGCQYAALGGKSSVDVEHLLSICDKRNIPAKKEYSAQVAKMKASLLSQGVDWSKGKVNKSLRKSIKGRWTSNFKTACEAQTYNTRTAVWSLMKDALTLTDNLPDIAATFLDCQWFADWVSRKGEDPYQTLLNAWADTVAEEAGQVASYEPLMIPKKIDYSKLPAIPTDYKTLLDGFRKAKGYSGTVEQDQTHQALLSVVKGQSILQIGCGLEKSVAASVFAAWSFRKHPVWIVCYNHKACKDALDRLSVLGVPESDIGYIAGWNDEVCVNQQVKQTASAREVYNKQKTPCLTCADSGKCPFYNKQFHFHAQIKKPIVVMTHKMFIAKFPIWSNATDNGVSKDTVVIIDEQLTRWETGVFTRSQIESALNLAGEDSQGILAAIDSACASSGEMFDSHKTVSGVGVIESGEGVRNRIDAIKSLSAHKLPEEEHLQAVQIATLLYSASTRYVLRGYHRQKGEVYGILTDRNVWDMPPKCVMLDGSARYTQVKWEGFTLYDGGMASVKGLKVHIVKGNPTKSSLEDQDRKKLFDDFCQEVIEEAKPSQVVYAENKGDRTFTAPTPNALRAFRGTDTRGSNDFLTADCMVVVMALFTDVMDYALRAALATGGPIECSAIWKKTPRGIVPNLHKNGFIDTRLQLAFTRQAVDELYQAIMRIGVRKYDGGEYTVVCRLPDRLSIKELKGRLPGAEFEVRGFEVSKNESQATKQQARFDNAASVAIDALNQSNNFRRLARLVQNRVA